VRRRQGDGCGFPDERLGDGWVGEIFFLGLAARSPGNQFSVSFLMLNIQKNLDACPLVKMAMDKHHVEQVTYINLSTFAGHSFHSVLLDFQGGSHGDCKTGTYIGVGLDMEHPP